MKKDSFKRAILCLVLIPVIMIASSITSIILIAFAFGNFSGGEWVIIFLVVLSIYSALTWRYLKKN